MKISQIQKDIKLLLEEKGFANGKDKFSVKVVLLHTEISELADAIKKGRTEDFGQELADIIIRLLNMPLMFPEWGDIWKDSTFESIPEVKFVHVQYHTYMAFPSLSPFFFAHSFKRFNPSNKLNPLTIEKIIVL